MAIIRREPENDTREYMEQKMHETGPMQNYFVNIPQIDNFLRAESNELPFNDSIFNDHDYGNTNSPGIINDMSFAFPDRKQYIFHTTNFSNMMVQYSNNMIVPMRHKPSLRSNYNLHTEFGRQNDDGVYIVDYYNVSRQFSNSGDFISSILDYYRASGNIYPDNLYLKEKITEKLNQLNLMRPGSSPNICIRVVTYIPQEFIAQYGLVYVPTSDLVVGSCQIAHNIVHPSSGIYRTFSRTLESDIKNYIEIDIVDRVGNVPYYVTVGNKIMTIFSEQAFDKPMGCNVSVYRNSEIISNLFSHLDQMDIAHGIYNTVELAQTSGNLGLINEANKLKNDLDRISLERDNIEYNKLKLEKDMIKMEAESKRFQAQLEVDIEKLKTTLSGYELENKKLELKHKELETALEKQKADHEHELKLKEIELEMANKEKERLEFRFDCEVISSFIDIAKMYMKANTDVLLDQMDIEKKMLDIAASKEKHRQDLEILEERQKERDLATIGSAVNLINTVAKVI